MVFADRQGKLKIMAMEDATLNKRTNSPLVLRAKADGKEYRLQGEMLVGREVECSIPLNSSHISRYHAKINVSTNAVYIEDLQSTNGTFINGVRIKGRVRLTMGDEVGFDNIIFRVASPESGNESKTALAPGFRHPNDGHTNPIHPNSSVPPIRPSATDADSAPAPQKASEHLSRAPGNARPFPAPEDIDLDGPPMSRRPTTNEPDFEEHLKQHFDELDALMDEHSNADNSPSAEASENEKPSPENAGSGGEHNAPPKALSSKEAFQAIESNVRPLTFPAAEPAPVPNSAVALLKVAPQESPIDVDSAKLTVNDMDRTQLLSNAQLDQFFERHRYDHDLKIGHGPRLIVTTAPLRGKLFNLSDFPNGSSAQLGRDPNAQIYLNDKTISTDHARLSKTDDGYLLTATHAKNGILINGIIQTHVHLSHNDKIQIGRTELLFKTDAGMDEALRHPQSDDPLLNNGHGRRYSIVITVVALIVLIGAIVATSR